MPQVPWSKATASTFQAVERGLTDKAAEFAAGTTLHEWTEDAPLARRHATRADGDAPLASRHAVHAGGEHLGGLQMDVVPHLRRDTRPHDALLVQACCELAVFCVFFAGQIQGRVAAQAEVAGMPGATSAEFDENAEFPVIDLMPEQEDVEDKGGTMRLGAYPCKVAPASMAFKAYGEELIYERHRHRYEVNNAFRDRLAAAGLVISGVSPDDRLVEMIELPDHSWFVASQGHPEFKSRPTRPHPLFRDFVAAALDHRE